jgi:hypothetical protein
MDADGRHYEAHTEARESAVGMEPTDFIGTHAAGSAPIPASAASVQSVFAALKLPCVGSGESASTLFLGSLRSMAGLLLERLQNGCAGMDPGCYGAVRGGPAGPRSS